jgi:hypothetical protein
MLRVSGNGSFIVAIECNHSARLMVRAPSNFLAVSARALRGLKRRF